MITFTTPPPGLSSTHFDLLGEEEVEGAYTLVSRDEPGVRLLVLDPGRWVADYAPRIPSSDLAVIDATDPVILVVVSTREGSVSVNLVAPVLINPDTGAAVQTILDGQGLAVSHTLEPTSL